MIPSLTAFVAADANPTVGPLTETLKWAKPADMIEQVFEIKAAE